MAHFILKYVPKRVRSSAFHRIFAGAREKHLDLFHDAELAFCPTVRMDLFPSDVGHRHIAYTGFTELPLTRMIARLAKQGGLMIDVGANYGYYSLLWAGTARRNRVIALEASPRVFPRFQSNLEKNHLLPQVEMHNLAAGAQAGYLSFSLGPDEQTGWGGFGKSDIGGEVVSVEVIPLDQLIPADIAISVLKIDVEGADTWVIQGARRLLEQKRIRHVFFEENPQRMELLGIDRTEAFSLLESLGYAVDASFQPNEHHAYPR